ncbi:hypothetical protein KR018_007559 [Drosophila ironensis]|nr:hypothetical protein KR018_007559 [Drosophila ironensis]
MEKFEFISVNRFFFRLKMLRLRFYLANIHYLGLMRLRWDKSQNTVQLTAASVFLTRLLGVLFTSNQWFFIQNYDDQWKDILFLMYYSLLLMQPKSVIKKRAELISSFLRLSKQFRRLCRPRVKPYWWLPITLCMGVSYGHILYVGITRMRLMVIIFVTNELGYWTVYITIDLLNIVVSLLTQYFETVNDEINTILDKLPIAILGANNREVKRMQLRLRLLQNMRRSCTKVTQKVFDQLGPQMLFAAYFNVNFMHLITFGETFAFKDYFVIGYSIRLYLLSLDELVRLSSAWEGTSWSNMANLLQFETIRFNCMAKTFNNFRYQDWWTSCNQCWIDNLIGPTFRILGLFTPNKRFLFRVVFVLCGINYVKIMVKMNLKF